jgi:ubiquinone biosynthesis protein
LDPDLDLWQTAKPILERWVSQQLGLRGFIEGLKKEAPNWAKILPTLPRLIAENLEQVHRKEQRPEFDLLKQLLVDERRNRRQWLGITLFLSGFLIGALLVLVRIHSI